MKYVMFEVCEGAAEHKVPIIFPNELVHRHVAGHLMPILRQMYGTVKVVSAGDVTFGGGLVSCSGRSETLNVASHSDDSHVISTHDYLHGLT